MRNESYLNKLLPTNVNTPIPEVKPAKSNADDYFKYSKPFLAEYMQYLDRPLADAGEIAIRLCEILSCNNCPVTIHSCDNRTDEDYMNGATCFGELHKWLEREFSGDKTAKSGEDCKWYPGVEHPEPYRNIVVRSYSGREYDDHYYSDGAYWRYVEDEEGNREGCLSKIRVVAWRYAEEGE